MKFEKKKFTVIFILSFFCLNSCNEKTENKVDLDKSKVDVRTTELKKYYSKRGWVYPIDVDLSKQLIDSMQSIFYNKQSWEESKIMEEVKKLFQLMLKEEFKRYEGIRIYGIKLIGDKKKGFLLICGVDFYRFARNSNGIVESREGHANVESFNVSREVAICNLGKGFITFSKWDNDENPVVSRLPPL